MISCEKSSCNRHSGAKSTDRTRARKALVKSTVGTAESAEIELLPQEFAPNRPDRRRRTHQG